MRTWKFRRKVVYRLSLLALVVGAMSSKAPETRPARFSEAGEDAQGFLVHTVESPFQAGNTKLRVLLPDEIGKVKPCRVLYVLPVEKLDEHRYGNGLAEVRKLDLHNRHGLICVCPTFSHLPWYADHPTDPNIRQESYVLKDVLPFVERTYPVVRGRRGRLLLGFSKSGWGAWSLLLRNPDAFEKAAAWDAPLTQPKPDRYGMRGIFATQENFTRYHIPSLLDRVGPTLGDGKRLGLFGYGGFRAHHESIRRKLLSLKVPHEYRDGPHRKHHWSGGWVAEAVTFLGESSRDESDRKKKD